LNIEFEMTPTELAECFTEGVGFDREFEIKIGNGIFTCNVQQYKSGKIAPGWQIGPTTWLVSAQGSSKRVQEIADAKALVNKTKEAHKEAQRKLAELTEGK